MTPINPATIAFQASLILDASHRAAFTNGLVGRQAEVLESIPGEWPGKSAYQIVRDTAISAGTVSPVLAKLMGKGLLERRQVGKSVMYRRLM